MERSYFYHKVRSKRVGVIVGWIILGVIAAVGFAFLFGYAIMLLWNWLMPAIFGLITINYWQAVGIIILAKLIFGGFGSHHKHSKSDRHKRSSRNSKSKAYKHGFSKWRHYEKFWKEEGKDAYKRFSEKYNNEMDSEEKPDPDSEEDKPLV